MTTAPSSPTAPSTLGDASTMRDEVVDLLRRLITCDTSNPPGNETQAAAIIEEFVAGSGLECERVADDPGRTNLMVSLRGRGDGPSLAFLSHLDVIGAYADEWSVEPFAGVIHEDALWGRGTVDMKCQVAATTVALARMAHAGFQPNGDIMLLFMADEEDGDKGIGAPFFVEERPDIKPDFVIGEGSGERHDTPHGPMYFLDRGVKGSASAKLIVDGKTGDASLPDIGRNSISETARLLERLRQWESPVVIPQEIEEMLDALAPGGEDPIERVAAARRISPAIDQLVGALVGTVWHPAIIEAPGPDNVVPHRTTTLISAITRPGMTAEEVERELRDALGDGTYQLEVETPEGGSTSTPNSPLRDAIEDFLGAADPDARLVPSLGYGLSDCHQFRKAHDSIAYGFLPFRHADPMVNLTTKHGADERILIDDLVFQVRAAEHIARYIGGLDAGSAG